MRGVILTWDSDDVPQRSHLAFQIKAGSLVSAPAEGSVMAFVGLATARRQRG